MEIIQPEFEVDVKPVNGKTLVRILDLTEGKIIDSKEFNLNTQNVLQMIREKLKEIV